MNLSDLPPPPLNAPVAQAPPPPPPPPPYRPPRPGMKRPSGEVSSDVALRSPLRERKKPQNMNYIKYAPSPPPKQAPPPVFSPKKAVSPPVSPKVHSSKSKKRKDRHRHHHQKKEDPESSKDDSNQDSGGIGKSPVRIAKSPAAPSPSGSDPEGETPKDSAEKTSSPIVCFIRLSYYMTFVCFVVTLIFWFMAAANGLHFVEIEFMENKFMGTQD